MFSTAISCELSNVLYCVMELMELANSMSVLVRQSPQWVLLTDVEVKERFVVIEERKRRIIENKLRAQMREEKRQKSEELLSKLAGARMQRKLEQQGSYMLCSFSNFVSLVH